MKSTSGPWRNIRSRVMVMHLLILLQSGVIFSLLKPPYHWGAVAMFMIQLLCISVDVKKWHDKEYWL